MTGVHIGKLSAPPLELHQLAREYGIHSFIVSVRNHPKMDLAEPQAVYLQARFLPEGVAQGTHEPRGNGQVAGLPQWTEVIFSIYLNYLKSFICFFLHFWLSIVNWWVLMFQKKV